MTPALTAARQTQKNINLKDKKSDSLLKLAYTNPENIQREKLTDCDRKHSEIIVNIIIKSSEMTRLEARG